MKVYKLTLEVKSPLIVTERAEGRLLRHSEHRYLRGETVRGAFLTYMWRSGKQKVVEEESKTPSLTFHPAYFLVEGSITRPAHPLIFECKVCGHIVSTLDKEALMNGTLHIPRHCEQGHAFTMSSLKGKLLYEKDGKLKKFSPRLTLIESVAINKAIKSAEEGMLYAYVALTPGYRLESLIVDLNNRISQFDPEERFDLYIGRGASRGLGHVSAHFTEVSSYIDKRATQLEKLASSSDARCVIFRALSPSFDISVNGTSIPPGPPQGFKPFYVSSFNNRYFLLTSTEKVAGFSLKSKLPRIAIEALDIGSLLFFEAQEAIDPYKLAEIELKGSGVFSNVGYNIWEVIQ